MNRANEILARADALNVTNTNLLAQSMFDVFTNLAEVRNIEKIFDLGWDTYGEFILRWGPEAVYGAVYFVLRVPSILNKIILITDRTDIGLQVKYIDNTTETLTAQELTISNRKFLIYTPTQKEIIEIAVGNTELKEKIVKVYGFRAVVLSKSSLSGTDIEIGAVEVKNDIDDTRLKIDSDNAARTGIYDTTGTRINPFDKRMFIGDNISEKLIDDTTEVAVTETTYTQKKLIPYGLVYRDFKYVRLNFRQFIKSDGTNTLYVRIYLLPLSSPIIETSTTSADYISVGKMLRIACQTGRLSLAYTKFKVEAYVSGGTGYVGETILYHQSKNLSPLYFRKRVILSSVGTETRDLYFSDLGLEDLTEELPLSAHIKKLIFELPRGVRITNIRSNLSAATFVNNEVYAYGEHKSFKIDTYLSRDEAILIDFVNRRGALINVPVVVEGYV